MPCCAVLCRAVQKKEIKALVLDSYVLDYAAGTECDLTTVGTDFEECECGAGAGGRQYSQQGCRARDVLCCCALTTNATPCCACFACFACCAGADDQATAFPKGFNNTALLNAYNEALVVLKQIGVICFAWAVDV